MNEKRNMQPVAFVLNLPWTVLGLLGGLLSVPKTVSVTAKPFVVTVTVRSFWWQTWLASHKGVRASTIGYVVLLGRKLLPHDLEHELVHVEQYRRMPFIHPFLYIYESLRHGYRQNKYEVEAYKRAGNEYVL